MGDSKFTAHHTILVEMCLHLKPTGFSPWVVHVVSNPHRTDPDKFQTFGLYPTKASGWGRFYSDRALCFGLLRKGDIMRKLAFFSLLAILLCSCVNKGVVADPASTSDEAKPVEAQESPKADESKPSDVAKDGDEVKPSDNKPEDEAPKASDAKPDEAPKASDAKPDEAPKANDVKPDEAKADDVKQAEAPKANDVKPDEAPAK